MPLIAAAGIPWLATIIGGFFTTLLAWLIQYFTKRTALAIAAITVIGTLTASMFAGIYGLASGIAYALPPEISQYSGMFLPSNTIACLTAISSAKMIRFAYEWQVRIIQWKFVGV